MKKYRIVKYTRMGGSWYNVEKKGLWWTPLRGGPEEDTIDFKTEGEARNYLKAYAKGTKVEIVDTITI